MEFIYNIFVLLHFIGMAGLVGGLLVGLTAKPKIIHKPVLHSGLLVLVAGIFLIIVNSIQRAFDSSVAVIEHGKVGIKLLIVVVILIIGFRYVKALEVPKKIYLTLFLLSIFNIIIAVFW